MLNELLFVPATKFYMTPELLLSHDDHMHVCDLCYKMTWQRLGCQMLAGEPWLFPRHESFVEEFGLCGGGRPPGSLELPLPGSWAECRTSCHGQFFNEVHRTPLVKRIMCNLC